MEKVQIKISEIKAIIDTMDLDSKVEFLNELKQGLHEISPFSEEPVDCVLWVKNEKVIANDYNPNSVAPPEMELLKVSIMADGYTQPIVTYPHEDVIEVVDGFHRNRVGKECEEVRTKLKGYLPIVAIKNSQQDKGDRIASTIRHNRARGKHRIDSMAEIVVDLKRRNWSNDKISRNLGMDADEILRLSQITGLAEMFADKEFSQAWEVADYITEKDDLEIVENNDEIKIEDEK
jgi:ParB-like chromosome segregation protein Spo0J